MSVEEQRGTCKSLLSSEAILAFEQHLAFAETAISEAAVEIPGGTLGGGGEGAHGPSISCIGPRARRSDELTAREHLFHPHRNLER